MSESESAPAAEAPTRTADVAANVIDSYEQASEAPDTGRDPGDETTETGAEPTTTATAPETQTATPAAPQALTEEEQLLAEFGFKDAKKPDGREHYIPRSKVLKMIGSGLKRGQEKWTTERTGLEARTREYAGHLAEMRQDVTGDPEVLLAKLADVNPRLKAYLDQRQPAQAPRQEAPSDKPQPDVDLGNGQMTYSVAGVEALTAWKAAQLLNERLKPLEDRDKAAQQAAQARDYAQQVRQQSETQMQTAQTWPSFGPLAQDGTLTEFQTAVLTRLQQDTQQAQQKGTRPTMSLREAYLEVYAERLSTDHHTVRAAVLKDLKTAPSAPALSRQAVDSPRAPGPVSTADVASKAYDRLMRGA